MNEEIPIETMNRIHNCTNPYQDGYKKVLCLCSAGLLRSPTAAYVLSQEPYNYNTRAAGTEGQYALFPVDIVHLTWADEIVVMEKRQVPIVEQMLTKVLNGKDKKIICLNVPDKYPYRHPELRQIIKKNYDDYLNVWSKTNDTKATDI